MRFFGLLLALAVFWVLSSGQIDPHHHGFLIGSGIVCCLAMAWLGRRLGSFDAESNPYPYLLGYLGFLPWLGWQIVLSNWDVAKRVWSPSRPIAPTVVRLPHDLLRPWTIATFANSVTLTPGTATIDATADEILVHCISTEVAEDLRQGAMLARVRRLEGRA